MKTFHITAKIDASDFNADDKEEAEKLFWNSISDAFGVASSIIDFEIKEQKTPIDKKEHIRFWGKKLEEKDENNNREK